jgi:predicted GNAT family N-acyltransferase
MDELKIVEIGDAVAREPAFAIRRAVFCVEQGIDPAEEFDGQDAASRHYLACLRGEAVGTARLRFLDSRTAKIERVAVLAPLRRRGIGAALTRRAIRDGLAAGAGSIVIHAQKHAESFYSRLGFVARGSPFAEAGIPHVRMSYAERPKT